MMEKSIKLTIDTKNQEDKNFVDYFYDAMYGLLQQNDFLNNNLMYNIAQSYKGNDGLINAGNFGVALFKEGYSDDDYVVCNSVDGVAVAIGATATTDATLGTMNQSECIDLTNEDEEVIGRRLVWDFPTGTANYEIKSIGLINNYFKNVDSFPTALRQSYTGYASLWRTNNYHYTLSAGEGVPRVHSYDCNGFLMYTKNGLIRRRKGLNIIVKNTSFGVDEELDERYEVSGFHVTHKVLHLKNDTYRCMATSEVSDCYFLLSLDASFNVTEQIELTGMSKNDEFLDWGLCGDYILLNYKLFLSSPLYKSYHIQTHELTNITSDIGKDPTAGLYSIKSINTYECLDGGFVADISRQTSAAATTSSYHSCKYTVVSQNEEGQLSYSTYTKSSSTAYCTPLYNIGTTPLCVFGVGSAGADQSAALDIAPRTCFKVFKLDTPIEKTEANTLKVTIDFVWGE